MDDGIARFVEWLDNNDIAYWNSSFRTVREADYDWEEPELTPEEIAQASGFSIAIIEAYMRQNRN